MFLTPYPDVNAFVGALLSAQQALLGPRLVALYLDGSLALGDFDAASDIDFIAVTASEISEDEFSALQAMHDRLARTDSPWAVQLEGSYISKAALRRHDPANALHPNLERGAGERLKWVEHEADWVIHRWVAREHGIVVIGPPPASLIDPVAPADLRRAASGVLRGWYAGFLADPQHLQARGYQSYAVLSVCRILYTLATGAVTSKPKAAVWAKARLGAAWAGLIDEALLQRHPPYGPADPAAIAATQDFIRLALQRADREEDADPS